MNARSYLCCLFFLVAAACGSDASAQPSNVWPNRPIHMLYGFAPGGADPPARMVALHLGEVLGQPVVFENRAGATGMIAGGLVAKSRPDGYTILYVTAGHALNYILQPKTAVHHPISDFSPISLVGYGPQVLIASTSLPVKDFKEFVAYAKARPGKLNFASSGTGGISHLTVELVKKVTGIDLAHVPFQGGGPLLAGLMGSQVEVGVIGAPPSIPLIQSGKIKALVVTSKDRTPMLPDVPSIAESGYPGFDASVWYGILSAAGTPAPIVNRLSKEIDAFINRPLTRNRFRELGVDVAGGSPERFTTHLKAEMAKWEPIIKDAGITVEQ